MRALAKKLKDEPIVLLAGFLLGTAIPTAVAVLGYLDSRHTDTEDAKRQRPSLLVRSVTTFTPSGIGARSGGAQNSDVWGQVRRLGLQGAPRAALTSRA